MNKNNNMIKYISRHIVVVLVIVSLFVLTSPGWLKTSDNIRTDVDEKVGQILGITVDASSYEKNYNDTLNRVNDAASVGVNHKLEDFAGISRTEIVVDDKDITFDYTFIDDKTALPFGVYTPSSTELATSGVPMIVWLHGSGEVGVNESVLHQRGLHKVLDNWTLDGFHAYVVTPQLAGPGNVGSWHSEKSVAQVKEIIDYFLANYNIDPSRVYLCGHSLGGMGTTYIAKRIPEYFAAIAQLSGYNCGNVSGLTMPIRGYVGKSGDTGSLTFMRQLFNDNGGYGSENLFLVSGGHGEVPNAVFNLDADENNKSDIIEWFLSHSL